MLYHPMVSLSARAVCNSIAITNHAIVLWSSNNLHSNGLLLKKRYWNSMIVEENVGRVEVTTAAGGRKERKLDLS